MAEEQINPKDQIEKEFRDGWFSTQHNYDSCTDLFAVGLLTRKGYVVKLRALEVAELEEDFKKGIY